MTITPARLSPPAPRFRLPRTRESLYAALWLFATLLLSALAYKRLFPGELVDADAMDYAQIARNLAAGHGFSTGILRPLALTGFVTPENGLAPDISHAPLYPFLLALAFAAHGGHGGAVIVVLTTLFFFALSAVGVYLLARTLLPAEGEWAALLAAGLYVLGGAPLGFAVSGLPVTLSTLLVTGLLLALHRAHEVASRPASPLAEAGVGMMLGLCFLAQYSLLLLAVPTLLYVWNSRAPARAPRGTLLCAAGFFVVSGAWLVHMTTVTGNPFFTLRAFDLFADTPDYPGATSIYRSVLPGSSLFAFFFSHLPFMLAKAGRGLGYYQQHGPDMFSVFVVAGALGSLLWRFPDIRVNILRAYIAVCLLSLLLVTAFFAPSVQVIAPFAPVLIVLAVGFVVQLMRRQDWTPLAQRVTLWAWGLLAAGGLAAFWSAPPPALNPVQQGISMTILPPLPPPLAGSVRQQILAGAVLTDTPWELTWRTGLPAVWLPRDNTAYEALIVRNGAGGKLNAPALLLTPEIGAYNDSSPEANAWLAFSTHPQAWQTAQQAQTSASRLPQQMAARAAYFRKLIAARDPRLHLTLSELNAQYAEALQTLPARVRQERQQARDTFTANYGPISEIVQDYAPAVVRSESNRVNSTLFIRRDAQPGLPPLLP